MAHEPQGSTPGGRRLRARFGACVALAVALLVIGGCSQGQKPLGASRPDEQVLRTLRLAGVRTAAVWDDSTAATVRIELPAADTAADPEIAWRSASAALGVAYPKAQKRVVELVGPSGTPLAVVTVDAEGYGASAEAPGAFAYTLEAAFEAPPKDAAAMGDLANRAYLDAKNRAVGLTDDQGYLTGDAAQAAIEATARLRENAAGRPAPAEDEDAGVAYARRIATLLADATEPSGVALREYAAAVAPGGDPDAVLVLRHRLAVVEAATEAPDGGVALSAAVTALAEQVASAAIPSDGPLAGAVLAAARDPKAPATSTDIARFEPTPSLDASGVAGEGQIPNRVLAASKAAGSDDAAVVWEDGRVAPETWPAYLRDDGSVFWRAGVDGEVALTAAAVKGFAWGRRGAVLVDAANVGEILTAYEIP